MKDKSLFLKKRSNSVPLINRDFDALNEKIIESTPFFKEMFRERLHSERLLKFKKDLECKRKAPIEFEESPQSAYSDDSLQDVSLEDPSVVKKT